MENIREQPSSTDKPRGLREELEALKTKQEELEKQNKKVEKKKFEWGWKAKKEAAKFGKPSMENTMLCDYLNKQGVWEGPMYLEIKGGNMIIYKNHAHEYRPREVTYRRIGNNVVPIYVIREIDRKPVSNKDWGAVKARGDHTQNDEILLKMLLMAGIEKSKTQDTKMLMYILGGLVLAGVAGYIFFG